MGKNIYAGNDVRSKITKNKIKFRKEQRKQNTRYTRVKKYPK